MNIILLLLFVFASHYNFFFFNYSATTEIYTLSLHDALPIYGPDRAVRRVVHAYHIVRGIGDRSEEHTSELQSQSNLVCRLLLEKKKSGQSLVTSFSRVGKRLWDSLESTLAAASHMGVVDRLI